MEGLKLNSGAVMPAIGLGIGSKEERTVDAIHAAIEIGYRCFDTARFYTTEPLLGGALARAFKAGLVRREDVFVTTKLHPCDTDDVVTALRSSLSDLQLDYVDLFLDSALASANQEGCRRVQSKTRGHYGHRPEGAVAGYGELRRCWDGEVDRCQQLVHQKAGRASRSCSNCSCRQPGGGASSLASGEAP